MDKQGTVPELIYISIIEDNRFFREGWKTVLSALDDFSIIGLYGSCEDAFQSEELSDSDIVLMDIGLPGISGIEGVKIISAKYPDMLVLMCTVHDDDAHVFDAICSGAVGYLLKKTSPEDLVKAIQDAMNGGSPMTPNIARKVLASFQQAKRKSIPTLNPLSEREREILQLMAMGKSYTGIADELFLSIDGVRYHIRNIYEKLHVHSRGEAIVQALKTKQILTPV